jgi:hypothetical protein
MKISKETIALLKNYTVINSNLLLKAGNKISTISTNKTVASIATVSESFPREFGIYDLSGFLGALSLFDDPELEFEEKYVNITENGNKIKYYAAEPSVLAYPSKDIQFPDSDINFSLSSAMLSTIQRTAGCLKATDVVITGDGANITMIIGDKKNPTGNTYETTVGQTDKTFKANIKIENLKMVGGDYDVSISNKKISRFKSIGTDVTYYVAVESDSTF